MKEDKNNFNIIETIKHFNFHDFFHIDDGGMHNGFILITDMQAIVGYTRGDGKGLHHDAFANALREVKRLDKLSFIGIRRLDNLSAKRDIRASLLNFDEVEPGIYFDFGELESITVNQLLLMISFAEKYNGVITEYSRERNEEIVNFYTKQKKTYSASDLIPVINYLKTIVDYEKQVDLDKKIISDININNARSDIDGFRKITL